MPKERPVGRGGTANKHEGNRWKGSGGDEDMKGKASGWGIKGVPEPLI